MTMKKVLLSFTLLLTVMGWSQERCNYTQKLNEVFDRHPEMVQLHEQTRNTIRQMADYSTESEQQTNNVITVPVVVHVLYKNANQNISDAQIDSQIAVLNADFRKLNADVNTVPLHFREMAADMEIAFVRASVTPSGQPTTGVTRKQVAANFNFDDNYYLASGQLAWNPNRYLNIWVGAFIDQGLLGWAYPPAAAGYSFDGLCIGYTNFGTMGTAQYPYNKGRTATHEIGHYFGLEHPWGDDGSACGTPQNSDGVADTPATSNPYYGCSAIYPSNSLTCVNSTHGAMFMNFMDYGDDRCIKMFSNGQKTIVRSTITNIRTQLLGVDNLVHYNDIKVYPNPAESFISIKTGVTPVDRVEFFDQSGRLVKTEAVADEAQIAISELQTGIYYLRLYNGDTYLKSDKLMKN